MEILCKHGDTIFISNILMVAGTSVLLAMVSAVLLAAGLLFFLSSPRSVFLTLLVCASAVLLAIVTTFELMMHSFNAVHIHFIQVTINMFGGSDLCSRAAVRFFVGTQFGHL